MREIYNKLAEVFKPILDLPYGDKIAHILVFGLLSIGSLLLPRISVISFIMFAVMLGIIWEMMTHITGISKFSIKDIIANAIGGFIMGMTFYFLVGIPFYIWIY